jgi:hypothetical protein
LKTITFTPNKILNTQKRGIVLILFFCSKFFILWACFWYIDYNNLYGYLIPIRRYNVKWWDFFATETKSSKPTIIEWLKQHQNAKIINSNPRSKFLARRSHAYAFIVSTKSEEKYFKIMKQLLQSIKDNDPSPSSSSAGSIIGLADDSEDECYGILPPIQKS